MIYNLIITPLLMQDIKNLISLECTKQINKTGIYEQLLLRSLNFEVQVIDSQWENSPNILPNY